MSLLSDGLFTLHGLRWETREVKEGRVQASEAQSVLGDPQPLSQSNINYLMKSISQPTRRFSLASLALVGMLALSSSVFAEEVLIYKVSASRKWQQDTALNPGKGTETGRRQLAGVARDTSYLILNRTTKEVVLVDYYTRIADGAKIKEYAVANQSYADWTGVFPSEEWEAQSVAALSGKTSLSLKTGKQEVGNEDLNGDGELDAFEEGTLSYFVGPAGARSFGVTALANVAASLKGAKRQSNDITYGPALDIIGGKFPLARVFYRGAAAQGAVLDTRTTATALNTAPPATSGETVATTSYALYLVRQLLDKGGYEDAAGSLLN